MTAETRDPDRPDRPGLPYRFFHRLARCLFWLAFRVEYHNREVLEHHKREGALLASNHVSYLDPPLVGSACRHPVYFLARKTLFRFRFSGWLFPRLRAIPVDQERPDMGSLKRIIKLVRSGKQVVIFPEGERTLDGMMKPAAPGTGLVVAKARPLVIPVRIFGAFEAMPRARPGRIRFEKIHLVVGEPFRFSPAELAAARGKEDYQKLTDRVMAAIAAIAPPEGVVAPSPDAASAEGAAAAG